VGPRSGPPVSSAPAEDVLCCTAASAGADTEAGVSVHRRAGGIPWSLANDASCAGGPTVANKAASTLGRQRANAATSGEALWIVPDAEQATGEPLAGVEQVVEGPRGVLGRHNRR
jgi:hypothetical protein